VKAADVKVVIQPVQFTQRGHKYALDGNPMVSVTTLLNIVDKPALKGWAAKETVKYLQGEPMTDGTPGWVSPPAWEPGRFYTADEIAAACEAAKGAFRRKSKKAKDRGTLAHEWIEAHVYGQKPETPADPMVASAVSAYMEWELSNNVEPVEHELRLAEPVAGIAGTIDQLAVVNGRLTVLDYKTSSGVYPEHHIQVDAYAYMVAPLVTVNGAPVAELRDGVLHFNQELDRLIIHIPKDGGAPEAHKATTDVSTSWRGVLGLKAVREALLDAGWEPGW
jgi:tellurite resistance-related uncharacterized protein